MACGRSRLHIAITPRGAFCRRSFVLMALGRSRAARRLGRHAKSMERFASHFIVQPMRLHSFVNVRSQTMKPKFKTYTEPAGGWGSVGSLRRSLTYERVLLSGTRILLHQNKPAGFACVSCSWAKPARPRPFEFCEEGAKATTWEITSRRCGPDFFRRAYGDRARIVDRSRSRRARPTDDIRCAMIALPTSMYR